MHLFRLSIFLHMAFIPIKFQLIDGTSNSITLQALDLQKSVFLLGVPEPENLHPLHWTECMIVLGTADNCYNPQWLDIGSIFPSNCHSTNPRAHSVLTHLSGTTPETSGPCPRSFKSVPLVTPQKPPRFTLINAAVYSHASKLEGLECFNSRSHSWGHWLSYHLGFWLIWAPFED